MTFYMKALLYGVKTLSKLTPFNYNNSSLEVTATTHTERLSSMARYILYRNTGQTVGIAFAFENCFKFKVLSQNPDKFLSAI